MIYTFIIHISVTECRVYLDIFAPSHINTRYIRDFPSSTSLHLWNDFIICEYESSVMLSWAVIVDNTDLYAIVCQVHCGTRLIFKLRIIRISLSGWLLCPFSRVDRLCGQDSFPLFCCQVVLLMGVIDCQSLIQDRPGLGWLAWLSYPDTSW